MALREDITAAMKSALKAKDHKRLGTLRLVLAAIKDKDIAARTETSREGVSDGDILGLLGKLIKSREDSIALYEQGHRQDLADAETAEIAVIREFLPQPMDAGQTDAAIEAAIAEVGAASMKDMGKAIAVLKAKYAGRMDFAKTSGLVKAKLSGPK
jgi:uncharacterized protein